MNSDPIENFPQLVLELIFQHFESYEVRTSSLVSTSWYEATGKSIKCMQRITIDLNKYSAKEKSADVIHQSSRQYRKVHAACFDKREKSEEVFWLLKKFESSIETLTAFSLNLGQDFEANPLEMTTLKELSVMDLSSKGCELIFNENHKIKRRFETRLENT